MHHLAQDVDIGSLFGELGKCHSGVGHRDFLPDKVDGSHLNLIRTHDGHPRSGRPPLRGKPLRATPSASCREADLHHFLGHQLLEHLIDRNRRHPIPHAWLAKWHVLRVQQGWSQDLRREAALAHDQTKAALDNDAESSLALAMDGFVHCLLFKNFDAADQSYRLALEINPSESLAWLFMGSMYAYRGEGGLAVRAADRALRLSPLDPTRYFYDSLAAAAALSAGQYERGLVLAQRSLRLNRMLASTWRAIVIAQVQLGHWDEARGSARSLLQLEPSLTASRTCSAIQAARIQSVEFGLNRSALQASQTDRRFAVGDVGFSATILDRTMTALGRLPATRMTADRHSILVAMALQTFRRVDVPASGVSPLRGEARRA